MDTTDLEARLRKPDRWDAHFSKGIGYGTKKSSPVPVEAADALAQQRAEIARLLNALVTAAIPLEALRLSGADKMHGPELDAGISEGIIAARQALEPRHD